MDIEKIKSLLSERHMTFEDLATKMGKERSVVYKTISNGNPTLNFLLKLSEALETTIDSIVSIEPAEVDSRPKADSIDGFVEVNGATYRIRTKQDLVDIINRLQ